jgi:hypothetical protein
MNEECFNRVANAIDAGHWGKKTQQAPQDAAWVRHIIDGEPVDA